MQRLLKRRETEACLVFMISW